MAAVVAQELTELSCVMIPLNGTQLLLPNVSIAEILPWRRVKALENGPQWCLGVLNFSILDFEFSILELIIQRSVDLKFRRLGGLDW